MNNTLENDFDVAVIGLGPVGCTAALLLAESGLTVIAIEMEEEVYRLPRAVNIDGEVVRGFQRVGRGDQLNNLLQSMRPGDRAGFANSKREWLFGQNAKPFGNNGWQPMNMFDQPEVETYLRNEVINHPRVTSLIGAEVTSVSNLTNKQGVTLNVAEGSEVFEFSARYAIACDGASSPVRKSLNIDWRDLGYNHEWLVVDVVLGEGHTLTNETLQVCDPARIVTYVATKDPYRRWEFKLNDGETRAQMLEHEMIMSLIDPWTPRGTYTIRRAAVYEFHAATAAAWRKGNIFIAGDAAHQTPPFLGQGMNTGIRDVINLSWKLPLVARGTAGEDLLDTYEAEREAHAHDLVDWAVNIGQLMEHLAAVERAEQHGQPAPKTPPALVSAGYGQGREQPPIRTGVVLLEQVSNAGSTGYLFAQPMVSDGDNNCFLLDELLGPGFAVVTREADLKLNQRSRDILTVLDARVVELSSLTLVRGYFDRLFEQHETAIIRPDRIVFGHTTDHHSIDHLFEQLSGKLSLSS